MPGLHNQRALLLFSLSSTFASLVSAAAAPYKMASPLMERAGAQLACAAQHSNELEACPPQLPFCCPTGYSCLSLLPSNAAVLCCPPGQSCKYIETIICDIQEQNATQFPLNLVHVAPSQLGSIVLEKCGANCCPLGYSCNGEACELQFLPSSTSTLASTLTSTSPSSTATPTTTTASSTATTQPISSQPSSPAATSTHIPVTAAPPPKSSVNGGAVALGVILSVGAIAGAIAAFLFLRRRKARTDSQKGLRPYHSRFHPSNNPNNNNNGGDPSYIADHYAAKRPIHKRDVSDPVTMPTYGGTHRTDFLLRPNGTPLTDGSSYTPAMSQRTPQGKQASPFATPLKIGLPSSPHPKNPASISAASDDLERDARDDKHASSETINVLMPPPLLPAGKHQSKHVSTKTTFSAMMEQAGLRRGEGFAGYPGRWSFAKGKH